MITFSKYKSTAIESGKRIVKLLQFGAKTAKQVAPFGIDSQPPEGMTAVYAETSNKAESVVIGYVGSNSVAEAGETRLYALAPDGSISSFVFLKANGQLWLNSADNSAVLWEPLQSALNSQNALIQAELSKISLAIESLGGIYSSATISTDITTAKSENVKLK